MPWVCARAKRMAPWLIIPVKSLTQGKSRLARVLGPERRRDLNELLLRRMLATAARFPGRRRTAVVSGCDQALAVAEQSGVTALREPRRRGLNAAVTWALGRVRARRAAPVIVAACDLPRLRAGDLRALAQAGARLPRGVLLCPDEGCSGTNALHLGPRAQLRFRFGAASLRRHVREARRRGVTVELHRSARIAADIDTPAELRRWQQELRHQRRRGRYQGPPPGAVKKRRKSAKKAAG
jgi:2-phospho-L-lactate/phosphoenolpyruvate guanylyltransferase